MVNVYIGALKSIPVTVLIHFHFQTLISKLKYWVFTQIVSKIPLKVIFSQHRRPCRIPQWDSLSGGYVAATLTHMPYCRFTAFRKKTCLMRIPTSAHPFRHFNNKWSLLPEPLPWVKGWCMGAQRGHTGRISRARVCTNGKWVMAKNVDIFDISDREKTRHWHFSHCQLQTESINTETKECLQD